MSVAPGSFSTTRLPWTVSHLSDDGSRSRITANLYSMRFTAVRSTMCPVHSGKMVGEVSRTRAASADQLPSSSQSPRTQTDSPGLVPGCITLNTNFTSCAASPTGGPATATAFPGGRSLASGGAYGSGLPKVRYKVTSSAILPSGSSCRLPSSFSQRKPLRSRARITPNLYSMRDPRFSSTRPVHSGNIPGAVSRMNAESGFHLPSCSQPPTTQTDSPGAVPPKRTLNTTLISDPIAMRKTSAPIEQMIPRISRQKTMRRYNPRGAWVSRAGLAVLIC
mmetsp:Transcript_15343/g.26320  ORF Transcript_15343/g.26320 Transcript_15343/m.26320 type:complete len:278 (+) Transcript_15343:1449-2282(+)